MPNSAESLQLSQQLTELFQNCDDLTIQPVAGEQITLFYFDHLMDKALYHQVVTHFLDDAPLEEGIKRMMGIWNQVNMPQDTQALSSVAAAILSGTMIAVYEGAIYEMNSGSGKSRAIQMSQKETSITGPHVAFVEDVDTNLSLVRRQLQTTSLKIQKFNVGKDIPINTYLLYLADEAPQQVVTEITTRLNKLSLRQAMDSTQIAKQLEDYPYSFFPQWLSTERPDTTCFQLMKGKVAVIIEGSPTVVIAPVSFLEFFGTIGDIYERWQFSFFIRTLRLLSAAIALLLSATYVAITTFHYQFIPPTLLTTMVQSRIRVPFDPMVEALLMEGVIELLREASARLPNKIAQTIGIVGGLVIGQAVVQAGLAGNVLIVAVAAGALASFTMPNYTMETSIRVLKFVMIIFAGYMGYYGIMLFIALLITHLCHLTSLKKDYLMLPHFIGFFTEGRDKLLHSLTKGYSNSKRGG